MGLLERVGTLLRANLNDLVDRAEDPEKMVKQVILDMENQFIQVKTQLAISVADLHLLERRRNENIQTRAEWMRKAELAVSKKQDDLARLAIERSLDAGRLTESFEEQVADQQGQVDSLKSALVKLQSKLSEARAKSEVLMAKHRRVTAAGRAAAARGAIEAQSDSSVWDRMANKVDRAQSVSHALAEVSGETLEDRFAGIEKQDRIEQLLAELKQRG